MPCDVLVSFADADQRWGEALASSIAQEGWRCRTSGSKEINDDGYSALVLIISRHSGESHIIRDAERAASRNLPIFPVRLDDEPLPRYLDYFAGSIGFVNAAALDHAEATAQLREALARRLAHPDAADRQVSESDLSEPAVAEEAPIFHSRPLLRRWTTILLAISFLAALANLVLTIAGMTVNVNQPGIRRFLTLVCAYTWAAAIYPLIVWFYTAYRNLLLLGATGLRYRRLRLFWHLITPPLNLWSGVFIIRDLLRKTPGRQARALDSLMSWSWTAGSLAVLLHATALTMMPAGTGGFFTGLMLTANLLLLFAIPLLKLLIQDVSSSQLAARSHGAVWHTLRDSTQYFSRTPRLLISYAPPDRHSAEMICNALEARNIDCWIPRLDGGDRGAAVDRFDGLLLVVSTNLQPAGPEFRELSRAIASGKLVIPFRIDRGTPPEAFQYLLGSLHWLEDGSSRPFDALIESVVHVVDRRVRSGTETVPATGLEEQAEDFKPGPARVRPSNWSWIRRGLFYFFAGVYGLLTWMIILSDLITVKATSPAYTVRGPESVFVTLTIARLTAAIPCLLLFFAANKWRGKRLWVLLFVPAQVGGLGAEWIACTNIGMAAAFDLFVGLAGAAAMAAGVSGVITGATTDVKDRRSTEEFQFDPQHAIQRWITRMSIFGTVWSIIWMLVIATAAIEADSPADVDDEELKSMMLSLLMHISMALVPLCVLFLVWLGVAYRNLLALGTPARYTPARAVRTLLNPLLNVFLMRPVIAEIWQASGGSPNRAARFSSLWCTLVLLYWTVLWVRIVSNLPPPDLRILAASEIVTCTLFVAIAVLTSRLVGSVNGLQMQKRLRRA